MVWVSMMIIQSYDYWTVISHRITRSGWLFCCWLRSIWNRTRNHIIIRGRRRRWWITFLLVIEWFEWYITTGCIITWMTTCILFFWCGCWWDVHFLFCWFLWFFIWLRCILGYCTWSSWIVSKIWKTFCMFILLHLKTIYERYTRKG